MNILPKKYLLVFLILISCLLYGCTNNKLKKVYVGNTCIYAEVADTPLKRQQGLMFRKTLKRDRGMLFVFEKEGEYSFWMKNMRFPLDIIWIAAHKNIVYLTENVPFCAGSCASITPPIKAKYVLEANAGFVATHNIKINNKVKIL